MANKSRFQINIEYYAAWLGFSSMRILPRKFAVAVGLLIGDIGYLLLGSRKKIAIQNTKIAFPNISGSERKRIVRGCFRSLGRQLGEISQFPKATKESLLDLVDFEYSEEDWLLYQEAKEQGRGIIFLTPHLGGWELLAFASSAVIDPMSYLVRPLDDPRLEKMAEEIRGKFGNRPIDKKDSLRGVLRLLRNGGNLGILPDQNSQIHEGVFVPFFGVPACTTAGVAALALRTNSYVVVFGAHWDPKRKKYVAQIGKIQELQSTKNRKQDMIDFTARFTKEIEDLIRKNPEQWMWIHGRWKTRPEGEDSIY